MLSLTMIIISIMAMKVTYFLKRGICEETRRCLFLFILLFSVAIYSKKDYAFFHHFDRRHELLS